ncbi:hypothetical protein GCM10010916_19080 [Paenibacillus abyssi]|uniref:Uncharacterized protein n=1 Tax=Paenibacillus abyssi TaxID=1340531 RepID=A0A917FUC3_9BACL|nr:hypothetical protein GCM10010916_19080 [Paenibacillus abyssi]
MDELKHGHGYDVATSSGLLGMKMQGSMAISQANIEVSRLKSVRQYNYFRQKKKTSIPKMQG